MTRDWIKFRGYEYPVIRIEGNKIDFECPIGVEYTICDIEFWWDVLERPCMEGDKEANEIDSQIFYYCDSGFVASEPTEQQVLDYFKGLTY